MISRYTRLVLGLKWKIRSKRIESCFGINAPIIVDNYKEIKKTIFMNDTTDSEIIVDCTPTFMCLTFGDNNAFFERDIMRLVSP